MQRLPEPHEVVEDMIAHVDFDSLTPEVSTGTAATEGAGEVRSAVRSTRLKDKSLKKEEAATKRITEAAWKQKICALKAAQLAEREAVLKQTQQNLPCRKSKHCQRRFQKEVHRLWHEAKCKAIETSSGASNTTGCARVTSVISWLFDEKSEAISAERREKLRGLDEVRTAVATQDQLEAELKLGKLEVREMPASVQKLWRWCVAGGAVLVSVGERDISSRADIGGSLWPATVVLMHTFPEPEKPGSACRMPRSPPLDLTETQKQAMSEIYTRIGTYVSTTMLREELEKKPGFRAAPLQYVPAMWKIQRWLTGEPKRRADAKKAQEASGSNGSSGIRPGKGQKLCPKCKQIIGARSTKCKWSGY